MPSKKKKYSARFPPARIKKIMQTDEDVGKVAAAVPVLISRALERFIETLIVRTSETTQAKNAKTLTTTHVKQTIHAEKKFDFLKDLVAAVPDHQTEEDTDNVGAQGDTKKQKVPRQKKQKEGGRKKRKTKNSSESSENDVNGEEEEEKESTSSTDTEEETSEHNRTHAENQKNPTNCEHETKYPTPSFSGHMMHPRLNQANNILPPMHVSASPMPVLPGNPFPTPPGLGVQYPMQVNNVIPHQTQPLDLCSTNSMYPQPMYSRPGYSYPQGYSCGQPLTPLVTPNSHQDQQLSSPGCKNTSQDGQGSRTFDQQTAMSAPNMNSQSQHSAKPVSQLPISLSSFSKLSTPQVCEDDDYDT